MNFKEIHISMGRKISANYQSYTIQVGATIECDGATPEEAYAEARAFVKLQLDNEINGTAEVTPAPLTPVPPPPHLSDLAGKPSGTETSILIGAIIKKTDKAILIKRADGKVKWIPKQYILDDTQLGRVILNKAGAWIMHKPWEEEAQQ